mmetsp:Transcript_1860/g.4002  ORF Transcript_1860/g.4002 Transcript_1860/m.4002 type:complete len:244 (+) Transcript_1860:143-874(+)
MEYVLFCFFGAVPCVVIALTGCNSADPPATLSSHCPWRLGCCSCCCCLRSPPCRATRSASESAFSASWRRPNANNSSPRLLRATTMACLLLASLASVCAASEGSRAVSWPIGTVPSPSPSRCTRQLAVSAAFVSTASCRWRQAKAASPRPRVRSSAASLPNEGARFTLPAPCARSLSPRPLSARYKGPSLLALASAWRGGSGGSEERRSISACVRPTSSQRSRKATSDLRLLSLAKSVAVRAL